MPDSHLTQMIEALRLEVAELKQRGATQLQIRGGEQIGTTGGFLYRFPLTQELKLRDEAQIRVVCDRVEVDGSVVSVANGYLIIALEEDLGPRIPSARLITDESFLFEKLQQKIEGVENGTVRFNHALAGSVIGIGPITCGFKNPDPKVFLNAELNDHKKYAINLAFGSTTCFIWGPPGTGKTTTLAHIVESHYRANRSVLIVSNTNIAVDTALERIAGRLEREPEFYEGAVLRHGPMAKDELKHKYGAYVSPDQVVERLGAELQREKREIENELPAIDRQAQPLREALQQLTQFEAFHKESAQVKLSLAATKEQWAELTGKRETIQNKLNTLQDNLRRARKMGRLRRFLTRLDPERLEQSIRSETRALSSVENAIQRAVAAIAADEGTQTRLQNGIDELRIRIANYSSITEVRKQLNGLDQSIAELRSSINSLQQQLDALRQQVLNNCRVLATTVYRTFLKGMEERTFDVVIVDEASMSMLPMTFFAAGLATESVVVAGDFRQLASIVRTKGPMAEEWLRKDAFEKSNIPEQAASGSPPQHLAVLKEQYRMHEKICACINELFYPDQKLTTNRRAANNPQPFPLGHQELLYIDTSLFKPWAAYRSGTYSRYNLLHALLINNLVEHLGEDLVGAKGDSKVGIISPYAEQTKLLQALLNDRLDGRGAELAATVHRFQGNERDTIIVDLTDSPGARLGGFMKAVQLDDDGARLLNVAISRARHRVVLVGNFGFLRGEAPEGGKLKQLLDYFEQFGEPVDAQDLLRLSEDDWSNGFSAVGVAQDVTLTDQTFSVLTEGTFYDRFAHDIRGARQEILLLSPYLTVRGAGRWMDVLRNATERGVSVRIVTCPPDEHDGELKDGLAKTLASILESGIAVEYRAEMHEKIAIIDAEILWHGSLNILSHSKTAESMLRIRSTSACAQVAKFVTTRTSGRRKSRESKSCPRPGCGGRLVKRKGPFGSFRGCSNFHSKRCGYTENIS